MEEREFEDDKTIPDNERLLRRLPPSWMIRDSSSGERVISSAAFKDQSLSICIESTMTRDGRSPIDAIRAYPGYGLASVTAGQSRSLRQSVARDPTPTEPAHGIISGKKKAGHVANKLAQLAVWVHRPASNR